MTFNLKTLTPDATFTDGAYLFGADSQSVSSPSVFSEASVRGYWDDLDWDWTGDHTFTGTVNLSGATLVLSGGTITFPANLEAIENLAVTDSGFIVGNGTTFVLETGATARTSLGVGTGDSPQFTAIELGHATDTTISRVSAGRIAVEGVNVVTTSSTDTLTNKTLTSPTINAGAMSGTFSGSPSFTGTMNFIGGMYLGEDDLTRGILRLYGSTVAFGGAIRHYNGATNDSVVDYFEVTAQSTEWRVNRDAAAIPDIAVTETGQVRLAEASGEVTIGENDSVPAVLSLYGGGTGEAGGALRIYNDADNDGTVDYYSIDATGGKLEIGGDGTPDITLDTAGNVGIGTTGPSTTLHANGPIRHLTYTVGTLPSASTVGAGTRAAVTDANATTFNSTVAGGGANFVPVISNGTNWLIG